jgi:hypothetical protein
MESSSVVKIQTLAGKCSRTTPLVEIPELIVAGEGRAGRYIYIDPRRT